MSTSNAIRFLAKSDGTDDTQIGLTYFMGSVAKAFEEATLLYGSPLIRHDFVGEGKSFQFIMESLITDGQNEAEDHTPGDELLGQPYAYEQGTITADALLAAHRDIPLDQDIWSHFPVLAAQGRAIGYSLAKKVDRRLLQTLILSYRTGSAMKNSLTIHNGGNNVIGVNTSSAIATAYPPTALGAALIRTHLADLAYTFDVSNVPEEDRYIFLHKHFRRVLTKDAGFAWGTAANVAAQTAFAAGNGASTLFSRDYQTGNEINSRKVLEIESFKVAGFYSFQSAGGQVPDTNITTGPSKYQVNCGGAVAGTSGKPVALAIAMPRGDSAALGMATYVGINPIIENDNRRSTTFLKAEVLCGAGKMHPWMCGGIEIGAA